ncbi:MAG: DUF4105 domain-containing protein [Bacteroidetes bacterium]|nr:DUF4105 domain-containing protein [Bacteroidota bacterium]
MKSSLQPISSLKTFWVLFIAFLHQVPLFSQIGVPLYLSEHTKVSLLTSSPGKDLYAKFGHSALRINDTLSGQDLVFNYGLFDFNTPGFYLKFVRGKLPYQLGIQRFEPFLNSYIEENRQLRELEINLSTQQRLALIDLLSINYLPENRAYSYDFFFDNCATRIRDILENNFQATYPDTTQVKKATFRHFLSDYVGQNSWINVGFYLILGIPSDAIATFRDEMFLPDYLEKHLENAKLGDKNLAKNKRKILFQNQPQKNDFQVFNPILIGWILFIIGLFISLFLSSRWINILEKAYFSFLLLTGVLFIFMWLGTDHFVTHKNMNLLWASPLYIFFIFKIIPKKQERYLILFLMATNLLVIIGWKFLPQEFHIAILPLILLNILRLTDKLNKSTRQEQNAK